MCANSTWNGSHESFLDLDFHGSSMEFHGSLGGSNLFSEHLTWTRLSHWRMWIMPFVSSTSTTGVPRESRWRRESQKSRVTGHWLHCEVCSQRAGGGGGVGSTVLCVDLSATNPVTPPGPQCCRLMGACCVGTAPSMSRPGRRRTSASRNTMRTMRMPELTPPEKRTELQDSVTSQPKRKPRIALKHNLDPIWGCCFQRIKGRVRMQWLPF